LRSCRVRRYGDAPRACGEGAPHVGCIGRVQNARAKRAIGEGLRDEGEQLQECENDGRGGNQALRLLARRLRSAAAI
jgi:hypothetical protein